MRLLVDCSSVNTEQLVGGKVYTLELQNLPSSRYTAECVVVAVMAPVVLESGPHPLKKQMLGFQRTAVALTPGAKVRAWTLLCRPSATLKR